MYFLIVIYFLFFGISKGKRKRRACSIGFYSSSPQNVAFYLDFLAFSRKPNGEFLVNIQENVVDSSINGEDGFESKINGED